MAIIVYHCCGTEGFALDAKARVAMWAETYDSADDAISRYADRRKMAVALGEIHRREGGWIRGCGRGLHASIQKRRSGD
jgi:hypothetical protein